MPKLTRTATIAALSAGLAAGGLLLPAAPASAAIQYSSQTGYSSGSWGLKSGGAGYTCDHVAAPTTNPDPGLPGNGDNPPAFTEGGAPATHSVSTTATVTNSLVPTDTLAAKVDVTSTMKVTGSGGRFTGFDFTGSGSGTVTTAQGALSGCYLSRYAGTETTTVVTIDQPGWLLIEATGQGTSSSASNPGYFWGGMWIQETEPFVDLANNVQYTYHADYGEIDIESHTAKHTARIFLKPGKYLINLGFEVQARTDWYHPNTLPPTYAASSSQSGSVHVAGAFQPAGAKSGPQVSTAKGKKFVKLLDRACAADKVTAKLSKKKLKNATKVVLTAGGKKKTVKLSKKFPKGGLVDIAGLPDANEVTLKATVFLKDKKAPKPTVEQSYLPCS